MLRPLAYGPADLPPWLLLVAAALALVMLWRTLAPGWRWWKSESAPRAQQPSLAQQRAVERDMQSLMHELSEMSRKIITQLDARSARLEQLIRDADERIARLNAAKNAQRSETSSPPPASAELNIEINPRNEQVYALDQEGLSVLQIANKLGITEGEVELILALRPPRRREAV